jgi:hypothetical protein
MRVVKIELSVYVPDVVIDGGDCAIEAYLLDKQYNDPEFFGEIDSGCFTVTDEWEAE